MAWPCDRQCTARRGSVPLRASAKRGSIGHDPVMRCNDQSIELVVSVVRERENHPVLSAFASADLDPANNAVGTGSGGNLDTVGFAALVVEHSGQIDGGRVAADADGVDRTRRLRGGKNHEAQREQRKAPDQTQCRFSAIANVSGRSKNPVAG